MIRQRTTTKRHSTFSIRENDEPPEKVPRYQCLNTRGNASDDAASSLPPTAQSFDIGTVLYDHFEELKEDMEALEVAALLKKKNILDKSSHEKIVQQRTRRMRVDVLIKALHEAMHRESGNIKVYNEFKTALKETGQQNIVRALQTQMLPCIPVKYENENLLKMFEKKKTAILNEIEPLKVMDSIVVFRGLHLHDHEEIAVAKSRRHRVDILYKHLKTMPKSQAWRILKPIKEGYKELFSDTYRTGKTYTTSSLSSSASSSPPRDSVLAPLSSDTATSSTSSDSLSGDEGPSMALTVNFSPVRKHSIAVAASTEHDHPLVKLNKIKELEKKTVDDVNKNPNRYKPGLTKLMDDCTSSFQSMSFSCIKINLQASSDLSVEQLKEFCRDGRAKALILSLLDQDTKQKLKELEATRASLDLYVGEKKSFIQILDETVEGCLCALRKDSIRSNFDYMVEQIKDLEMPFIDKVLDSDILAEDQKKTLLTIKECADETERRRKLIEFLLEEDVCQTLFCLLENEILMSGEAQIIRRIQQTKIRKVSDSKRTHSGEAAPITASDLREHAELLEEEIDPRWFLSNLQSRTDDKSSEIVKIIQDSQSRKERTKPFLEYLYAESNLHWFEQALATKNKYIFHELQLHRSQESVPIQKLKVAFMSAYDVITDDLEPLQLVEHLSSSFLQQTDFASLKDISTRQGRAQLFIRRLLTLSDTTIEEVLEAMRNSYSDVVATIEEILRRGSLCEKYKCPRIRRYHRKRPECVFSTEISLFEADTNGRSAKPQEFSSPERLRKNKLASGFVQAEVTMYDRRKEYWSSYDRYNTNIGVIGSQTSCKSSLLHAMCGRIETDEETAQVYVETDVKKFSSYKEARNVVFWDLPEIGTKQFPRETYLKDIDFKRYDCFAMTIPGQIVLDNNILVAREIANLHRKVVLICCNKGNLQVPRTTPEPVAHCSSAENITEKQAVEEVRKKCYKSLQELGFTETPLFIIKEDAILSGNYDFDKLIAKLIEEVSDAKHDL